MCARRTPTSLSTELSTSLRAFRPTRPVRTDNLGVLPHQSEVLTSILPSSETAFFRLSSIRAVGRERLGDDPIYIADQMGHTDPSFTFRVYQRAVKRRGRLKGAHLRAFDAALEWARMGSHGRMAPPRPQERGRIPHR
jgi:hypothetical protein